MFAISVALGIHEKERERCEAHATWLGERTFGSMDLSGVEGVVEAMKLQDPRLLPANALKQLESLTAEEKDVKQLLVTSEANWNDLRRRGIGSELAFICLLSREGGLRLLQLKNGFRQEVAALSTDLQERLFNRRKVEITAKTSSENIAFLSAEIPPLYFPAPQFGEKQGTGFSPRYGGGIGVDTLGRLLFWYDKNHGAIELSHDMPSTKYGHYFWGFTDSGEMGAFVGLYNYHGNNTWLRYTIPIIVDQNIPKVEKEEFEKSGDTISYGTVARFENDCMLFSNFPQKEMVTVYDWTNRRFYERKKVIEDTKAMWFPGNSNPYTFIQEIEKGTGLFHRINKLAVDIHGNLFLGNHMLAFSEKEHLVFARHSGSYPEDAISAKKVDKTIPLKSENNRIHLRPFEWEDGSKAYVDNRGLLHLISSDPALPQITVLLVLNRQTACWASDGSLGGSSFYHHDGMPRSVSYFQEKYMKPFFSQLSHYVE
jgi:hypothetical protein